MENTKLLKLAEKWFQLNDMQTTIDKDVPRRGRTEFINSHQARVRSSRLYMGAYV